MNRNIRMTGFAIVGIALGTAVLLLFAPTFRGVNSFWYFWIPFAFLAAMIVLGSIPGHSDRSIRWQSLLEENCRKGTDS